MARKKRSALLLVVALTFLPVAAPALAVEREQALALIDGGKELPSPWTLEDVSVDSSQIVFAFRSPDIGSVSVVAEARNPEQPSFAATRNLNLSYVVPATGLTEVQEMAVGRFMKELSKIVERNDTEPLFPLPPAAPASSGNEGDGGSNSGPSGRGGHDPGHAGSGTGLDGQAGRNGIDYGGVSAQTPSAAGLLVVDALLWVLGLAGLALVVRVVTRELRSWGRAAAIGTVLLVALSALVRFVWVPHVTVQVGMGHPVIASALTLDELPRYGAAGPLLYHALFRLLPAGMESVLRLHTVLSLLNVLLLATWFLRLTRGFRGLPTDPGPVGRFPLFSLACVAFLAFTPLFLRDGNSESLLVPAVFLLFSGALLVQEHAMSSTLDRQSAPNSTGQGVEGLPSPAPGRSADPGGMPRTLLLSAGVVLLALGSHMRPELLLVAPMLAVVTLLPYRGSGLPLRPLVAAAAALLVLTTPYASFVSAAVAEEASRGNLSADRFAPHLMVFDFLWRNLFFKPLFFPAGVTALFVATLAAGVAWRPARPLLPVLGLALVWMSLYHVDFNDESMLRLHVPGMMLVTLAALAGLRLLELRLSVPACAATSGERAGSDTPYDHAGTPCLPGHPGAVPLPGRRGVVRRFLPAAVLLLAAGSAAPTAWHVFFPTSYQVQDRLFPQLVAALPSEPVSFVSLTGRDMPDRAWSEASLAEDPNREGAPPVHRFFPSYLLQPPLRSDRLMSVTEFRDRPDRSRRTFFFLSAQCYAMREPFGYEEWGVDPDPLRLMHPACRWMLVRHVPVPVLLFRVPAHGEFAAPFQWYPPSLKEMTIGLFELKPGDSTGKPPRDSFTRVAGEYFTRAREPLLTGDFDQARRILTDAEGLLVDSTALWDSLASIYFLEGARKDDPELLRTSLDYLLKIADKDLRYPEILKSIGAVHARLKLFLTDDQDAVYIRDRLARDPDDLVGLWLEAVRLFYTHEHYEESLVLLRRILERVDTDPRVYVYVALDHFYLGRKAEAEAAVAKAIEVADGSDPDAYYVRSIIVRDRDLELAAQDIQRYLDMSEGPDKVRNEVKQKWLREELKRLREGRPSPWWKGGGHDEPWTRVAPEHE